MITSRSVVFNEERMPFLKKKKGIKLSSKEIEEMDAHFEVELDKLVNQPDEGVDRDMPHPIVTEEPIPDTNYSLVLQELPENVPHRRRNLRRAGGIELCDDNL